MTKTITQVEDVLLDLMALDELGDEQIVAAIERNPEFKDPILAFYEDWLTNDDGREAQASEAGAGDYVPDISELWAEPVEIPNPFAGHPPSSLKAIATRCEISLSVLTSLQERGIWAATIPLQLMNLLAEEFRTTTMMLRNFLNQDEQLLASDFRADNAPVHGGKVSFADAVKSSSMSDAQKDKWLKLSE